MDHRHRRPRDHRCGVSKAWRYSWTPALRPVRWGAPSTPGMFMHAFTQGACAKWHVHIGSKRQARLRPLPPSRPKLGVHLSRGHDNLPRSRRYLSSQPGARGESASHRAHGRAAWTPSTYARAARLRRRKNSAPPSRYLT